MRELMTSGTLGDCYITALKLYNIEGDTRVYHYVHNSHKYWREPMQDLLMLAPSVKEVVFTDAPRYDLPRVHSNFKDPDKIELVPQWFVRPDTLFNKPTDKFGLPDGYRVICVNSGKPKGMGINTKLLHPQDVEQFLQPEISTVLVGTEKMFTNWTRDYCVNLVGKTSLQEVMTLVSHANSFLGPEGLLLFVALSHKVKSKGFYTSQEAMEKRVIGTPWEDFATLHPCASGMDCTLVYQ